MNSQPSETQTHVKPKYDPGVARSELITARIAAVEDLETLLQTHFKRWRNPLLPAKYTSKHLAVLDVRSGDRVLVSRRIVMVTKYNLSFVPDATPTYHIAMDAADVSLKFVPGGIELVDTEPPIMVPYVDFLLEARDPSSLAIQAARQLVDDMKEDIWNGILDNFPSNVVDLILNTNSPPGP